MTRQIRIGVFLTAAVLFSSVRLMAQHQTPEVPSPPTYGAPPLKAPSMLAGLWEASGEHGGIVGIQVSIHTSGENVSSLEFGLFERMGSEFSNLPFIHYFDPQESGAYVCYWDGHHLTIDFVPPHPKVKLTPEQEFMFLVTPVHVDLVWNEAAGTWTGLFQYKSSLGQIVLRRPAPAAAGRTNPFVGDWIEKGSPPESCLHIAEESDGMLIGWHDIIPPPEPNIVGRNMVPSMRNIPQPTMMGQYGELTKVGLDNAGQITVEFGAYSGMCCSSFFKGRLSADGTLLAGVVSGGALQDPNDSSQRAQPVTWNRATGQSCSAGNAMHVAR